MPWESDKQRKYMYSQHPKIAKKMQKEMMSEKEYKYRKYNRKKGK